MKRPTVIIESPYSNGAQESNVKGNLEYGYEACLHAINCGEAPLASHLLYTQFLNDNDPVERVIGIECGLSFAPSVSAIAFYVDYGISEGMLKSLYSFAEDIRLRDRVVFRSITGDMGTIQTCCQDYQLLIQSFNEEAETVDPDLVEGIQNSRESLFTSVKRAVTKED